MGTKKSVIERISEALHLLPRIPEREHASGAKLPLRAYPDPDDWDDYVASASRTR
jgi:hypothetical protein